MVTECADYCVDKILGLRPVTWGVGGRWGRCGGRGQRGGSAAGAWLVCVFVVGCGRLVYNVFVGDAFVRVHNIPARCGFVQPT
jgi:hypothetical protein